mmetsp:Transcript_16126/g.28631  ORF Transcript_16126/g.28631 Transcript_16126/m.28631 type:complete len:313 (-) Transcript_16126:90-1028(-)|eukprot:CAMPEP_0184557182 /NCGR_PEP_ID=MMETSP0199_2-20130426/42076_1 /TAXON_ID=1112570 /ORGANISM="Thraustochytrium sp., Strain LLF1b" /LENGTH=312 /DNA_ID=CAMNT_0026954041 /DNA_START=219 /DNA_END=1157 /DNA_ORIENTATION=+
MGAEGLTTVLRKVTEQDRDTIARITKDVYGGHDFLLDEMSDLIANGKFYALATTSDDKVVATLNITPDLSGKIGKTTGLRVDPELGGRGLGSEIVEKVFGVEKGNFSRITYVVAEVNKASYRIAEKARLNKTHTLTFYGFDKEQCGFSMEEWQQRLQQDLASEHKQVNFTSPQLEDVAQFIGQLGPHQDYFLYRWEYHPLNLEELENVKKANDTFQVFKGGDCVSFGDFEKVGTPKVHGSVVVVACRGDSDFIQAHATHWVSLARSQEGCERFSVFVMCPEETGGWLTSKLSEENCLKVCVFEDRQPPRSEP